MTKRTSKAAGIVPAAGMAAAVAAVVAADASAGTEGERPNDDAGVAGLAGADQGEAPANGQPGTEELGPSDVSADLDGKALITGGADVLPAGGLFPATRLAFLDASALPIFDQDDEDVSKAVKAVDQIKSAASIDDAFFAVLDASSLIMQIVAKLVRDRHQAEPDAPAGTALIPDHLAGRVLEVRAIVSGGRRRAGYAFGSEPQPVNVDDLSGEQLAAILSDDHLAVQVTD